MKTKFMRISLVSNNYDQILNLMNRNSLEKSLPGGLTIKGVLLIEDRKAEDASGYLPRVSCQLVIGYWTPNPNSFAGMV